MAQGPEGLSQFFYEDQRIFTWNRNPGNIKIVAPAPLVRDTVSTIEIARTWKIIMEFCGFFLHEEGAGRAVVYGNI